VSKSALIHKSMDLQKKQAAALFGDFHTDRLAMEIQSSVDAWPKDVQNFNDQQGNYAKIVRWTGKYSNARRRSFVEARIHPAVEWLLEILVPALCDKDPKRFKLFAEAIELVRYHKFPARPHLFAALVVAHQLAGCVPAFNELGERATVDIHSTNDPGQLPIGFRQFKGRVEQYLRKRGTPLSLNDGTFYRDCVEVLGLTFQKDARRGGRPSKNRQVLLRRAEKQKRSS
jgi:hypothetical protein